MKVDFRLTLMHSVRSVWRKNKIEGSTDIYPLTLLCMWIAAYNWWNEKHEYAVSENLESEKYLKERDHAYKQILKLKNCINICLTEAIIKPSKPIEFLHCNHEAKELLEEAQKQADALIANATKQSNALIAEAQKQADELIAEAQKLLKEAPKQADELIAEAQKLLEEAQKQADDLIAEAQKQADELIAEAEKAKECFYEILDENGDFVRIDKECDYETECGNE